MKHTRFISKDDIDYIRFKLQMSQEGVSDDNIKSMYLRINEHIQNNLENIIERATIVSFLEVIGDPTAKEKREQLLSLILG